MRLPGIDNTAAELLVELGDAAGAVDETLAALHDDVGIGADHG